MSLDIYNSTIDRISFSKQGFAFLYYSNSNSWYAKYATNKIGRNKIMLLFVLAQLFPTHREEFMWESRISYNKVIQIVGNGQKVRLGLDPPGIPGGVPYLKENCSHLASSKARIRYVDPACFGGFCRRPSSNDVLTTHAIVVQRQLRSRTTSDQFQRSGEILQHYPWTTRGGKTMLGGLLLSAERVSHLSRVLGWQIITSLMYCYFYIFF